MAQIFQDVRFAMRSLRKGFLVTALILASLALALGGNISVFSFVNGLLFRPLPFEEADRIVVVDERAKSQMETDAWMSSPANFLDWRERVRNLQGLAALREDHPSLSQGDSPERLSGFLVTANFFSLLGVDAILGRMFHPDEDQLGRHRVVVLGYGFWQRRFGGDPDIVGRDVTLNNEAYTVVGVTPADFEFLHPSVEVWMPLTLDSADLPRDKRDLIAIGRLNDKVTMAQIRAEMKSVGDQLAEEYPDANQGFSAGALNLRYEYPDKRIRRLLFMLQGAVIFVLLIACFNIVNLLLARSQIRQREMALRTALGAGRWRIIRQLITESLLLAVLGGIFGLGLSVAAIRAMATALAPLVPSYWMPVLDNHVLVFGFVTTVLVGVFLGVAPAVQSLRQNLTDVIKEGGRGALTSRRRRLFIQGLVVIELALAMTLLGGGSVLVRSFLDFQNADPGFDKENLLVAPVSLPEGKYLEEVERKRLYDQILERLAALPGAKAAAVTNSLPMSPGSPLETFSIDGRPRASDEALPQAVWLTTSPSYLGAMEVALLKGRFFTEADRDDAELVAVINQVTANKHWPDTDPIDRHITIRDASRRIVGVVSNVWQTLPESREKGEATIYVPVAQIPGRSTNIVLRPSGEPQSLVQPVGREIRAIDTELTVGAVQTFDQHVGRYFVGYKIFNTILIGFGILALFLAALGTYGLLSYTVSQRTQEIGIRMAMGARRREVIQMVTRQGFMLALFGLVIGIPGAIAVTRMIGTLQSDSSPIRPLTTLLVALVLLAVALVSSLRPAQKAASVDPIQAIRYE